ncbi:guanylate kinase [Thermodesulfobacteriota bacterium]
MKINGKIYVFSGPSGVGKSTLIKKLRERVKDLGYSISHTSRKPRDNEANGLDYHFVDRDMFNRMIDEGAFVEWATIYGDLYGTSFSGLRDQVGQGLDVLLDLDSQGAKNIKEHFQDSILIYILPPSLDVLEKRLRRRATDGDDVIDLRIRQARDELLNCEWYEYLIINDTIEKAFGEAESIIVSDRCRNTRSLPKVKEIIGI